MSRPRSSPDRVADALRQVLQRIDPERRLAVYRVWTFWDDVVGAALATRTQPAGFRDGVLSVRVGGAVWMQELQFMKEDLRERLNARLGGELIREIFFISGTVDRPAPHAAAPPEAVEDGEPIELPPLRDPRLVEVMGRIVRAHRRRRRQ
jgi:predicted nucleic acid-binding Zn ribbon protein